MTVDAASPALDRVARGDLCAGCGACAALAPGKAAMAVSPAGFLRPVQAAPFDANEEAAVAAVCPGLGLPPPAVDPDAPDDLYWGPTRTVRTGWAVDPAVRHAGASGGALTAVVGHLLAAGEAAFAVVVGPDPKTPWANAVRIVEDPDGAFACAGSRYAPSAPLADLPAWLAREAPFVFVGKPCDVAALRAMAARDPRIDRLARWKLSFFCAGVPSLAGAEALLARMGAEPEAVDAFRYRGEGWPGRARATLRSGETRSLSYAQSWGEVLSSRLQFRCKICPDGVGGAADLVAADAWVCDAAGYPAFEERPGVSLIVARTAEGARLLATAEAAGAVTTEPARLEDVAPMQPGQTRRKRLVAARLAALAATGGPVPDFAGRRLGEAARQAGIVANLKNFLGAGRRILQRRGRPEVV